MGKHFWPSHEYAYRKKRVERIREYINSIKGRGCDICGYNKCLSALDFHHVRGEKSFPVSKPGERSIELIQQEIDKCILVCANCHREIHDDGNGSFNREPPVLKETPQTVFNFFIQMEV